VILSWDKPVILFYKEKSKGPFREPFLVVRARRLTVTKSEKGKKYRGLIEDFIHYMGDVDYISTHTGPANRFVMCWMDDREDDFDKAWRKLNGVTFKTGPALKDGGRGKFGGFKRTFNARFEAEKGKLG